MQDNIEVVPEDFIETFLDEIEEVPNEENSEYEIEIRASMIIVINYLWNKINRSIDRIAIKCVYYDNFNVFLKMLYQILDTEPYILEISCFNTSIIYNFVLE